MRVVLDASVVVKWLLADNPDEEDVDRAMEIFDRVKSGDYQAVQPLHWRVEVLAVITRVQPARVAVATGLLESLGFQVLDSVEVYQRATALSVKLQHHLFDTMYHAVALETGADLVTADKKYARKARGEGALQLLGRRDG